MWRILEQDRHAHFFSDEDIRTLAADLKAEFPRKVTTKSKTRMPV
jgi:hypothetical protein